MTRKPVPAAFKAGHREGLEAMRDLLAMHMEDSPPTVVAQIAARLQAVAKELAEMESPKETSTSDDLAKRREARRSAVAETPPAAAGGRKQRRK